MSETFSALDGTLVCCSFREVSHHALVEFPFNSFCVSVKRDLCRFEAFIQVSFDKFMFVSLLFKALHSLMQSYSRCVNV